MAGSTCASKKTSSVTTRTTAFWLFSVLMRGVLSTFTVPCSLIASRSIFVLEFFRTRFRTGLSRPWVDWKAISTYLPETFAQSIPILSVSRIVTSRICTSIATWRRSDSSSRASKLSTRRMRGHSAVTCTRPAMALATRTRPVESERLIAGAASSAAEAPVGVSASKTTVCSAAITCGQMSMVEVVLRLLRFSSVPWPPPPPPSLLEPPPDWLLLRRAETCSSPLPSRLVTG